MTDSKWNFPQEVSDALGAFPASVKHLMPAMNDIPDEFIETVSIGGLGMPKKRGWCDFQRHWFYSGLSGDVGFHCKPGVDGATAVRHLRCIQGSYEPKHEHKVAAVAYLASLWFHEIVDGDLSWGPVA